MSTSPTQADDDFTSANSFTAPVFGEAARSLIACNQKLQELGIDDTIKLPRIVVIGDQSTGKSSLIEAISSVSVPKAAGLCTKCPIAINLSHADGVRWRCCIYIEEKFLYNPGQTEITQSTPLGPWTLSVDPKTTLVKEIDDPAELGDLIDLAQRLLLNPLRNPSAPLGSNLPKHDIETFSPNTIRLDISAAGWVNLSFIDLPGVITRSGKGQPAYYVQLVENLARQHALDKNNIIMLTLPLNHDNVNSKSYSIIETQKVHSRTIAVFTKADLASREQVEQCLKQHFDEESPEEFGFGEHMVMLDIGEQSFFDQEPWTSLPKMQHKLGVTNLVHRIREILFEQTRETLPHNLECISLRFEKVTQLLRALPAPPDADSLPWKLREQFFKFESHNQTLFGHGSLSRNQLNSRMEKFAAQIVEDKPTIKYKTKTEASDLEDAQARLCAVSESEMIDYEDDESSEEDKGSPSKKAKESDPRSYRFTLEEVRTLNKQLYQSGIAGEIEPKAVEEMNVLSVQYWQKTLDSFVAKVRSLIKQHVRKCIEEHFAHQEHLPLYKSVQDLALQFQDIACAEGKQLLHQKCKAEMMTPFTLDNCSRQRYEKMILKERLDERKEVRLVVARAVQKAECVEQGRKLKGKAIDESALEPDEWELEIQMSAKSAAYYELASKRFADNICQDILTHLIPRIQSDLVPFIRESLGLDNIEANQARIAELMFENPEREAERRRLIIEQQNLMAGHAYISNVIGSVPTMFSRESSDTMMEDEVVEYVDSPKPSTISPNKRKTMTSNSGEGEVVTPTKRSKRNINTEKHQDPSVHLPRRGRSSNTEG